MDEPSKETEIREDDLETSEPDNEIEVENEEDRRENEQRLRSKIMREGLRHVIVQAVQRNVPHLTETVEKRVAKIYKLNILDRLAMSIYEETDEVRVEELLSRAIFDAKGYIDYDPEMPYLNTYISRLNFERERELAKIEALQATIVEFVKIRFPHLIKLAEEQVQLIDTWKTMEAILPDLFTGDEKKVRKILLKLPGYQIYWDK